MGCCAESRARTGSIVLLMLVACIAPVRAQSSDAFADRVAAAIAERWAVSPSVLRLEWERGAPSAAGSFSLEGGAAGEWVVMIPANGRNENRRLRAGVLLTCPTAARDLPRATAIAASDIARSTVTHWGPPPRNGCDDVEGWVTRRAVRMGEPLTAPAIAPPAAVRSGDRVRVTFIRGSVAVTLDGRAAGTGAIGERVLVHTQTGRRVMTTITGAGTVEVREAA